MTVKKTPSTPPSKRPTVDHMQGNGQGPDLPPPQHTQGNGVDHLPPPQHTQGNGVDHLPPPQHMQGNGQGPDLPPDAWRKMQGKALELPRPPKRGDGAIEIPIGTPGVTEIPIGTPGTPPAKKSGE